MVSLVIDIQSDVVEGSLIKFPPKGTSRMPHILYSASLHIPRKHHTDEDYLVKTMVRTLEELSLGISRELPRLSPEPVESIHYILSTPWAVSQTKTGKIDEPGTVVIEQKVFGLDPEVSSAFTLSSEKIIRKIQAAVTAHLRIKKEFFHSAILLQYLTSRTMMGDGGEYCVLHIHGEHTDVVVVKKGLTPFLATFPTGTSTLVRNMSHAMKSSYEAASSSIKMYTQLQLDEMEHKKIEKILLTLMKAWQRDYSEALTGLGETSPLPQKIHLYSGESCAPLFKNVLEELGCEVVIHHEPLREVHSFALKDVI